MDLLAVDSEERTSFSLIEELTQMWLRDRHHCVSSSEHSQAASRMCQFSFLKDEMLILNLQDFDIATLT